MCLVPATETATPTIGDRQRMPTCRPRWHRDLPHTENDRNGRKIWPTPGIEPVAPAPTLLQWRPIQWKLFPLFLLVANKVVSLEFQIGLYKRLCTFLSYLNLIFDNLLERKNQDGKPFTRVPSLLSLCSILFGFILIWLYSHLLTFSFGFVLIWLCFCFPVNITHTKFGEDWCLQSFGHNSQNVIIDLEDDPGDDLDFKVIRWLGIIEVI